MDELLRQSAIESLNYLRQSVEAHSLTCHFLNPFSGHYWIFHKDGTFNYDHLMHGPITHPDQVLRFTYGSREPATDCVEEKDNGISIAFMKTIPKALQDNVLQGKSFANREGIRCTVRIHLGEWKPAAAEPDETPHVFIFLNYTEPREFVITDTIRRQLDLLRNWLFRLASQPRVSDTSACQLRSAMLRFKQMLGDVIVGHGSSLKESGRTLYDFIVDQTNRLVRPSGSTAENRVCTLSLVGTDNQVETVAKVPGDLLVPDPHPGIVGYVARTGHIVQVEDVQKYMDRWLKNQANPDPCCPKYEECDKLVKCELACPLVIQGRVVGVLNLESNSRQSYDAQHVIMLVTFAAAAAQAVRQLTLWRALHVMIDHQHRLLESNSEESIFSQTLRAVEELGYVEPGIWDASATLPHWCQVPSGVEKRNDPRPKGFTRSVLTSRVPIALADVRMTERYGLWCDPYLGCISDGGFFERWEKAGNTLSAIPPSNDLKVFVKSDETVLTDLGFPIVEGGDNPNVRAVLWAKCKRHFRSLLIDECWILSVLCRNASEALRVWRDRFNSSANLRRELLEYHFGQRAPEIATLLDQYPNALSPVPTDELVIMNLDIRGSTKLLQDLKHNRNAEQYRTFVTDFHDHARQVVLEFGGIWDKTIGDGVHAIFNAYRHDVLNVQPPDKTEVSKQRAVKCVLHILEHFARAVEDFSKISCARLDPDLCLGGGLSIGGDYVGSFASSTITTGLEYTVHGEGPSIAAKLMGLSRRTSLIEFVNTAPPREVQVPDSGGRYDAASPDKRREIAQYLSENGKSILLVDFEFDLAVKSLGYKCCKLWLPGSKICLLIMW